mgnify:CR=1 FL=1
MARKTNDFEFFGLARPDADGYIRIYRRRSKFEAWYRLVLMFAALVISVAGICKLLA